jgi:hypothetical protein
VVVIKKCNVRIESVLTLQILLFIVLIITSSSIPWLLLNNKFAYAGAISASVRLNGKTVYAIATSARSTNKPTIADTAKAVPSSSPSSKALPSLTRSLSTIISKIKGTNNNNTLTKNPSFLMATIPHGPLKSKKINIAFVKPSFTAAAYDNSFYYFYTLYKDTPAKKNVTANLNLLTSKVTSQTTDSSSSAFAMAQNPT